MPTIPWERVRAIVDAVLDLPAEARSAYLDQACAEPAVRRYVESLVHSYEKADGFLAEPAMALHAQSLAEQAPGSWKGRRIGAYQMIESIGEGGMGEVYRAVRADDQYRKVVAIKLVRGGFDSRFTLARFKAERQILANLDHPNITRLLDGGATEEGQPFLVMEYVQGLPLDAYCDQHALTVTGRLELFRTVCAAVQFAHQNLVIHRDLKPGNILVTADGVPKLLDFGIAKILDPEAAGAEALRTLTMVRLLTPEYASPEQLRGEPISTASDVYSLGVVLYELLTGHRPYRLSSRKPEEVARAVAETEPEKPSAAITRVEETTGNTGEPLQLTPEGVSRTREGSVERLRRRLAGDLDNIVLMALRKEPQRRYPSAEQLSADLRRHLEGRPVVARTDTFTYRSSRFLKRHAAGVAAAAIITASLVGGLAIALREARIARLQQTRAERRFNDVRKLANSLIFDIHDSIRDLPGSTAARKLLVDRAVEYLDSLAQESRGDPSLQRELAAAYERLGLVQGDTAAGSVGDITGAWKSYGKELAIRQALTSSPAATVQDRLGLARSLGRMGRLSVQMGDMSGALDFTRRSTAVMENLRSADPDNRDVLLQLDAAYDALGDTLSSETAGSGGMGRWEEAAAIHSKGVQLGLTLTKLYPHDLEAWRYLAIGYRKVGNDQLKAGQRQEALANFVRGKDVFARLAAENPASARLRRSLAAMYSSIGDAQTWDGDLTGALATSQKLLEMNRAAAEADPKNQQAQIDLVLALDSIGYDQSRLRQFHDAEVNLQRARGIAEMVAKSDPKNFYARSVLAYCHVYLGELYQAEHAQPAALASYQNALGILEPLAASDPSDVDTHLAVASAESKIGEVLAKLGHWSEASAAYQKGLAGAEPLAAAKPSNEWARYVVADSVYGLGDTCSGRAAHAPLPDQIKSLREARSWYQRSADTWKQVHNPSAINPGGFECGSLKQVSAALTRCDTALAELEHPAAQ